MAAEIPSAIQLPSQTQPDAGFARCMRAGQLGYAPLLDDSDVTPIRPQNDCGEQQRSDAPQGFVGHEQVERKTDDGERNGNREDRQHDSNQGELEDPAPRSSRPAVQFGLCVHRDLAAQFTWETVVAGTNQS